jgi:predicted ATPase
MAEPTPAPTAPDVRLLRSITLRNILSFGPDTPPLELRALNVLIGPNGSGKSNLLSCLSLLPALAGDWSVPFRVAGSTIKDWFWKGPTTDLASLEISIEPAQVEYLVHSIAFDEINYQARMQYEMISIHSDDHFKLRKPHRIYLADSPSVMEIDGERQLSFLDNNLSVLAQLRDRKSYPEFARLVKAYEGLVFFRDWSFGGISPIRQPQRADSPGNFLRDGGENLGLVLNQLRREPEIKQRIISLLNELYEGIDDYETFVQAGYVEFFLREGKHLIPASRLSDGTLRFLCLLAILLHPTPPPLICLEEPELGLHPDAVVAVGKLILQASERTQLIVTTHSDILVDVLGQVPENIVVCEKNDGQTQMTRLNEADLSGWLERYSLSQLWTKGKLGGNRW